MSDTRYNGWTNYETWLANLWIDNEQGSQEYFRERAQESLNDAADNADEDDSDGSIRAAAAESLKGELEQWLEEQLPEPVGLVHDLLSSAVQAIDWQEIAEHMVADADMPERTKTEDDDDTEGA